jgi:hypothetical protein
LARIQTPDRSGLPSAVRGVGAFINTLPWASRGTDGSTTLGHCAATETEHATTNATTVSFTAQPPWKYQLAIVPPVSAIDDGDPQDVTLTGQPDANVAA